MKMSLSDNMQTLLGILAFAAVCAFGVSQCAGYLISPAHCQDECRLAATGTRPGRNFTTDELRVCLDACGRLK